MRDQGLTHSEAAARLATAGANELVPRRKAGSVFAWILRLIVDPMVILLAIAGITYVVLGDRFDAVVVSLALLPIFFVTAVLEFRSDRALERLREVAPARALVLRDFVETLIAAREVVPGDLLILREGDVVAADAQLLETSRLLIDESVLTGESLPVEKRVTAGTPTAVLAGTIVRSGRGTARVERTGAHTEYGRIGRKLTQMRVQRTPIERSIHRIVFQVGIGVVVACAFVIIIERGHGVPMAGAIIAGVSLAMAAIPEELPMVYTLYLALGAWRLAKDQALVRRLASVETLGSTTVICVDKTGTLTYGQLAVDAVFSVPGVSRQEVLAFAAMASEPRSGDPLDRAILASATPPDAAFERKLELPFDPARRFAAAVWSNGARSILAVKGAYEAVAARGAAQESALAKDFLEAAAVRGARVLAIAVADVDRFDEQTAQSATVRLVGMIAFADRVREAAREAVTHCRDAGIRVMMVTGDHPATARAVAWAAGMRTDIVASGEEQLERWSDDQLRGRIADVDVFARVRPEEKLRIVRALHARGDIVAMTGDGTNDALALREADIGIAMGKSGTEVARAAADLVLLDDDVTTIVRAIGDGRRIFDNLRHAFSYLNAFHIPLLLSAFVLPLAGVPIFLMPVHLIWLEVIVHPTSALIFENDPPRADVMARPPRSPRAGLLRPGDWIWAFAHGLTLAVVVIAVYAMLLHEGLPENSARTAGMATMLAGQIMLVFVERAGHHPVWSVSLRKNPAIAPIVLGTAATLVVAVLWQPLALALHLATVPANVAAFCVVIGCAAVLWTQPFYALRRL